MRRAVVVVMAACGGGGRADVATFPAEPNPQVDLLFVADNSNNTAEFRMSLESAPAIGDVLAQLDAVDLRVGLASTDLGAAGASVSGATICDGDGDGGAVTPTTLADLATASAALGVRGCLFVAPFGVIQRAVPRFQRPGANVAIVVVSEVDDCTVTDPQFVHDDALGPLDVSRCTRTGLRCDEDLDSAGQKHDCVANPDSPYLLDPATVAGFGQVSVIGGRPDVVDLELAPGQGSTPYLQLVQKTGAGAGLHAQPAVRLAQLAALTGGATTSALTVPWTSQLTDIGHRIKALVGDPCLPDGSDGCDASSGSIEVVEDPKACPDTADHLRAVVTGGSGTVTVSCDTAK